jgi:pimeloyl-ACP methyl ester carboxylesterase
MSGIWSEVVIAGRPADVYEPDGGARPRFGVVFLHDLDLHTPRDWPAFTRLFDELRMACVCPRGGRCWWVDRPCPEFDAARTPARHVLEEVRPFAADRWAVRVVGLLGVGMGGQGALRLAFRHPTEFPAVAALAPSIEYHQLHGRGTVLDDMYESREQCRQDTAVLHVSPVQAPPHIFFCIDPDDDEWHRGNDRLHEKLGALGVAHACDLTTRAGGHSSEYVERMAEPAIRFLAGGLEQEGRRLL